MTPNMTLVFGGECNRETLRAHLPSQAYADPALWYYYTFYGNEPTKVNGYVHSFFGEFDLKTPIVDITAGARYDKNNRFEAARLPRLALTRRWGDLYVKGLASRAYHPPTLMTLAWIDPELKPEYARDYEAEVGYKPSPDTLLRLNAFAIGMKPVILYSGVFSNTSVRSRGMEAEARLKKRWGSLDATYSFYRAHYDDLENAMAEHEDGTPVHGVTLGFPAHKATLSAGVRFAEGLSVNPGLVWFSRRYVRSASHYWNGTTDDYVPFNQVLGPMVLANLYVRRVFSNGWEAGIGVFNLFDRKYSSVTGSYLGNPPNPGPSREFVTRTGYRF
jgi:outer membrane receptor protein involved in Fe transport